MIGTLSNIVGTTRRRNFRRNNVNSSLSSSLSMSAVVLLLSLQLLLVFQITSSTITTTCRDAPCATKGHDSKQSVKFTMFQIKNSIFISFFLIATAISATNASGGKCWGQNNSCPDTLVNFAEMNGKTLCCSPNGGCGGATYTEGDGDDSTSNVQDCSEAVVESILSIEDTTSSGSASIFALTASSIVAPFVVMLMN